MNCGTPIDLAPGDLRLSVFSPAGDTGDYSFNLLDAQTTDLSTIELNTPIRGTLAQSTALTATLPSQPGDRIYIASDQDEDCSREWSVVDASGTTIRRNRQCGDLGLIAIGNSTPYRILMRPADTTQFAFTVSSVGQTNQTNTGGMRRFDLVVNTPGQSASADFVAGAGERLYVWRDSGISSGRLLVQDPTGATVASNAPNEADVQFQAGAAGTYTVLLEPDRDFTGTVPIEVIAVADDVELRVNRGETFTLSISTLGQRSTALFSAQAGESFTVTLISSEVSSGLRAIPRIFPPGGVSPLSVVTNGRSFTAEQTGQYQLVVEPRENDDFIGSITFELR
jgi:hypothetical protein